MLPFFFKPSKLPIEFIKKKNHVLFSVAKSVDVFIETQEYRNPRTFLSYQLKLKYVVKGFLQAEDVVVMLKLLDAFL